MGMCSQNNITGALQKTKRATNLSRIGWLNTFGKLEDFEQENRIRKTLGLSPLEIPNNLT